MIKFILGIAAGFIFYGISYLLGNENIDPFIYGVVGMAITHIHFK